MTFILKITCGWIGFKIFTARQLGFQGLRININLKTQGVRFIVNDAKHKARLRFLILKNHEKGCKLNKIDSPYIHVSFEFLGIGTDLNNGQKFL